MHNVSRSIPKLPNTLGFGGIWTQETYPKDQTSEGIRYRNCWRPVTHKNGALPVISIWATYKSTYRGYNPSDPFIRSFPGFITYTFITYPPCSHSDGCSYYQLWLAVSGLIAAFRPICRRRLVGTGWCHFRGVFFVCVFLMGLQGHTVWTPKKNKMKPWKWWFQIWICIYTCFFFQLFISQVSMFVFRGGVRLQVQVSSATQPKLGRRCPRTTSWNAVNWLV